MTTILNEIKYGFHILTERYDFTAVTMRLAVCCMAILMATHAIQAKGKVDNQPKIYRGKYFGQQPPGKQPQLFMPGFISTDKNEFNAAFSPDGREFYFSIAQNNAETIYVSHQKDGLWSKPVLAPFASQFKDADPIFGPKGKRLYFISTRPLDTQQTKAKDWDIWYVERVRDRWSSPKNLGPPVNSAKDEWYISFTTEGTLYFASNRDGGLGRHDIYYSRRVKGTYAEPVHLGPNVNSKYLEQDPFVSPDGRYILFTSVNRPGGVGSGDIYLSYRDKNGQWSKAVNLGKSINTPSFDYCPILSPDGNYFFYTSKGDIYWIDVDYIEAKIPKELHLGSTK